MQSHSTSGTSTMQSRTQVRSVAPSVTKPVPPPGFSGVESGKVKNKTYQRVDGPSYRLNSYLAHWGRPEYQALVAVMR